MRAETNGFLFGTVAALAEQKPLYLEEISARGKLSPADAIEPQWQKTESLTDSAVEIQLFLNMVFGQISSNEQPTQTIPNGWIMVAGE